MGKTTSVFSALAVAAALSACGVQDTRQEVVYPHAQPVPRTPAYSGQQAGADSCPGDAEELAPGSICPSSAQCFEISGGRRCISYEP